MIKKLLSIIFLVLFSGNAYADLYKAKSFNCVYYHTSIGEIKNNKYKVESEKSNNFTFSIVSINQTTKKSLMVGNNGTDEMTVINTEQSGIHFLQGTPCTFPLITSSFILSASLNIAMFYNLCPHYSKNSRF